MHHDRILRFGGLWPCGLVNYIIRSIRYNTTIPASVIKIIMFFMIDSPLPQNPLLEFNRSYINLTWSPPFLWPGHAIEYFNVSITNESDGSVTYHRINNTFNDSVVSYGKEMQEEPLMCTDITLNISAISAYNYSTLQQPNQMYSVSAKILPSRRLNHRSLITVLL